MVYKWYILPIGGLYTTYHLLGEPETTIDLPDLLVAHLFLRPVAGRATSIAVSTLGKVSGRPTSELHGFAVKLDHLNH